MEMECFLLRNLLGYVVLRGMDEWVINQTCVFGAHFCVVFKAWRF